MKMQHFKRFFFYAPLLTGLFMHLPAVYGQQDTVSRKTVFPEIASPARRVTEQPEAERKRNKVSPPPVTPEKPALFVRTDTVLKGPSPLDTSKNTENKFLSDFYDTHFPTNLKAVTDWKTWGVHNRETDLDYRIRQVRDSWPLTVMIITLFFAAIILRYYRKDVILLFRNLVNLRPKTQNLRDQQILHIPAFLILLILFGLVSGLTAYLGLQGENLSIPYRGAELLLLLSGLSVLLYLLKVALLKAAAFIFRIQEIVQSCLDIFHMMILGFSCFTLPVLILYVLGPPQLSTPMLYLLITVSVFFLAYLYGRTIFHTLSSFQFPKIYLITYLCAFEICPILILIKFFF